MLILQVLQLRAYFSYCDLMLFAHISFLDAFFQSDHIALLIPPISVIDFIPMIDTDFPLKSYGNHTACLIWQRD